MAVANYHETYGCFPPAYVADRDGKPMHSWRVLILPFLEQRELYNAYNFAEPWDGPNNRKLADGSGGSTSAPAWSRIRSARPASWRWSAPRQPGPAAQP